MGQGISLDLIGYKKKFILGWFSTELRKTLKKLLNWFGEFVIACALSVNRLLGWWSIDEGSREEEARLYFAGSAGLVHYLTSYVYIADL